MNDPSDARALAFTQSNMTVPGEKVGFGVSKSEHNSQPPLHGSSPSTPYQETEQPMLTIVGERNERDKEKTETTEGGVRSEKVTRAAKGFLWNVKSNLGLLSIILGILLYCVTERLPLNLPMLILSPIYLFLAYLKASSIWAREALTKQAKLYRVLTSSQVVDGLGGSLAAIGFFVVPYVSSFQYTFCIGPVALASTIVICKSLFGKKENEGETFGAIFLTILRIFLVLQFSNFMLKMDDFVSFTWKEVYWPFWIFFSIMIGLSFSIFLIVATKLCSFIISKKDSTESMFCFTSVLTLLWVFYFVDGFTVMICLFVIFSQNFLTSGEQFQFQLTLLGFIFYCLFGIVITHLVKTDLINFVMNLSSDSDFLDAELGHQRSDMGQTNLEGAVSEKAVEKEQIEIPEYLFKYSSTFFKTATKKELFLKKLFSNKSNQDNQNSGKNTKQGLSLERSKSTTNNQEDSSSQNNNKTLKKTDMSMSNFHLPVRENQDLYKHYR